MSQRERPLSADKLGRREYWGKIPAYGDHAQTFTRLHRSSKGHASSILVDVPIDGLVLIGQSFRIALSTLSDRVKQARHCGRLQHNAMPFHTSDTPRGAHHRITVTQYQISIYSCSMSPPQDASSHHSSYGKIHVL